MIGDPGTVGWPAMLESMGFVPTDNLGNIKLDDYVGFDFINDFHPVYGGPSEDPPSPPPLPGWGIPTLSQTDSDQALELLNPGNIDAMKHLTNNFHQFFYKHMAQSMLDEVKQTPEFRLMYDHLFPMKRYMTLAFMLASDSLSKFIPEPTDILNITKDHISKVVEGLEATLDGDYTYLPDPLANYLMNQMQIDQTDTQAQAPNLDKQILMIILRTPLLILKGFVEVTDPAIIIAKSIINIANAIQQGVIGAIDAGIRTVKQVTEAAKQTVKSTMVGIESTIQSLVLPLGPVKDIALNFPVGGTGENIVYAKDLVHLEISGDVQNWNIQIDPLPPGAEEAMLDSGMSSEEVEKALEEWENISSEVASIKDLQNDYVNAQAEFNEIDKKLKEDIGKLENDLKEAKKVMKEVFQSPFLLPGMWAAMLPSYVPFGGGIPPLPSPFPGFGPPSTIPGMIYLALLFLDAYEEMQHRQSELSNEEDVNCEDEL